jgi:hypothetical protein
MRIRAQWEAHNGRHTGKSTASQTCTPSGMANLRQTWLRLEHWIVLAYIIIKFTNHYETYSLRSERFGNLWEIHQSKDSIGSGSLSLGFSLIFLTTKFSFGDPLGVGVPLFHLHDFDAVTLSSRKSVFAGVADGFLDGFGVNIFL